MKGTDFCFTLRISRFDVVRGYFRQVLVSPKLLFERNWTGTTWFVVFMGMNTGLLIVRFFKFIGNPICHFKPCICAASVSPVPYSLIFPNRTALFKPWNCGEYVCRVVSGETRTPYEHCGFSKGYLVNREDEHLDANTFHHPRFRSVNGRCEVIKSAAERRKVSFSRIAPNTPFLFSK